MAYKIKNVYKEAHIMDLNMMGIREYRNTKFSFTELMFLVTPAIIFGVAYLAMMIPEMTFMADCQSFGTRDVCYIKMH